MVFTFSLTNLKWLSLVTKITSENLANIFLLKMGFTQANSSAHGRLQGSSTWLWTSLIKQSDILMSLDPGDNDKVPAEKRINPEHLALNKYMTTQHTITC